MFRSASGYVDAAGDSDHGQHLAEGGPGSTHEPVQLPGHGAERGHDRGSERCQDRHADYDQTGN